MNELQTKLHRLSEFLDRHELDGVMLWHRNNFAWITCGRDNHIANNSPVGVAAIFATRDSRVCFANSIEAPRMIGEELAGTGINTVSFPWYDNGVAARVVNEVLAGRHIAADADPLGLGLAALPADFAELRWSLTVEEVARYRDGAQRCALAMEAVCHAIKPGETEHEIAGAIDDAIHAAGVNPVVTLVSSDDRLPKYRHPIPTNAKVHRHAMLVVCGEYGGMISNLTRFIHFGPLSAELAAKQQAIANVDTAVNLATRPGKTLGEIFKTLQQAYADNGWADQWQLHHQGGSTGYAGREVFATPDSKVMVRPNQTFAWNPSIVGAKSEDTMLVTASGLDVLTKCSEKWPMVTGTWKGQTLVRPAILIK
jgi:Xaa-Pro aminopeptidase